MSREILLLYLQYLNKRNSFPKFVNHFLFHVHFWKKVSIHGKRWNLNNLK